MTRRLTWAIVGAVVATLVVAGAGTLLLAQIGARANTKDDLRDKAQELAAAIEDADGPGAARLLANLRRALSLDDISLLVVGPGGRIGGPVPASVSTTDLDLDRLRAGDTLAGSSGSLVWAAAAAPIQPIGPREAEALAVVVVTRRADALVRPAVGWFLLASAFTIAIATVVATRLGRRLTEPVRAAERAARRIAAGDLGARVEAPPPEADDELAALARSVNAMADALERSRGLERQFLMSVSHDLRTPLTSIRGYAEAIADGATDDPAAAATVILSESRRLDRLVRDLLDLAKLDSRRFSLHSEPVDLVDVAAGTAEGFGREAADAGVELVVDASGPLRLMADPDRLSQVVANLIENALKFAATTIRVDLDATGDEARMVVSDDGPGIAADDAPHIFERLYVATRHPRRKEAGSGLGLAIVRELVGAMGGSVRAEASASGGRLVVTLPLSRSVPTDPPSSTTWSSLTDSTPSTPAPTTT